MIGKIISHYEIIEQLGCGGMGVVYKAKDVKLDRTVAIKFLPPSFSFDKEAKKRFIHEAKATSTIDHSNICTIHEIGETDGTSEIPAGQLYIVMAYYEGKTLDEWIKEGPLKIEDALRIAIQVCEGLDKAHSKDIVHRDIKPANIMLLDDGTVKILDFGLAKVSGQTQLTQMGSTVGTVSYMSPEQAKGELVDQRSDIWSIGVILYEMITGKQPFMGEYNQALIYSVINEEPEPPTALRTGVPMEIERIINKTIKKKSDERYQTTKDLIIDLKAINDSKNTMSRTIVQNNIVKKAFRNRIQSWIVGSVVIAILCLIAILYLSSNKEVIESIAVLPLESLSGDKEQEYFVDGMTDALISELANISALRVISRTSVMQYKKARKPIQEIANELNVDALVEGTVLYDDDQIRITVQLIKANPEKHIWASDYKRDLRNIFELQSEVAQNIANEINVKVTPDEQIRLTTSKEVDPEVYKLYLMGYYNADKVTPDGLKRSNDYFNRAIEKDSNFALAYMGLAELSLRKSFLNGFRGVNLSEFKKYAKKAIELDKTQSNIYRMEASLKFWNDWDILGAEEDIKKALEFNPSSADAHDLYCHILTVRGRLEEAIIEREKAMQLDPLSHVVFCNGCYTYYAAHKYDKAIDLAQKTIEQFGSACSFEDQIIGWSYNEKGMYDKAVEILEKRKQISKRDLRVIGELSRAYALAGQKDKAKQNLEELNELSVKRKGQPEYYLSAIAYTALAENDKALDNLEKSYDTREFMFPWVKVDQRLDPLKSNPRFKEILSKLNY